MPAAAKKIQKAVKYKTEGILGMAIYAIGDLHLSLGGTKPMDVFRGWEDYLARLEQNWRELVMPEDTVVLAGDTSWGMKLADCVADFTFLNHLPGEKLLMKGNHDYWWTTVSKMQTFFTQNGWDSLRFLHNNAYLREGLALCGTRSWLFDLGQPHDEKVMNREKGRLLASLEAAEHVAPQAEKVAFLHYPPLSATAQAAEIVEILQCSGVRRCYYGHLHGGALPYAVQGVVDGVDYRLISADGLRFCPLRIETG